MAPERASRADLKGAAAILSRAAATTYSVLRRLYMKLSEKWQASSPVEPAGEVDARGQGVQLALLMLE
jgi:hypothetical protein